MAKSPWVKSPAKSIKKMRFCPKINELIEVKNMKILEHKYATVAFLLVSLLVLSSFVIISDSVNGTVKASINR